MLVTAAFWLLPTLGLFVESLRDPADSASTGWWTVFTRPSQLSLRNYQHLMADGAITGSDPAKNGVMTTWSPKTK